MKPCYLLCVAFFFSFCTNKKEEKIQPSTQTPPVVIEKKTPLFTLVNSQKSGIIFNNFNKENNDYNYFAYEYFYNGGGVATADFNNDGLLDIVFTANMASNKLYINKGDFTVFKILQQQLA